MAVAPTPPATRRGRRLPAGPLALVPLLVLAGATPLAWVGRFYFRGDTQIAYLGWWYHLGERLREGHLPLMEPLAWEAGNHVAEGQWGLFSPLTILVGLLATVAPNVVVFVTAVKIGLVVLGGTGTYLLTRSYGAREPFAVVAGLVVGLAGQSVFFDWPSWVNGQIGAALLPWAWWLTRRAMAGRNPAGALVACYLVVSVGYVYCALFLAVVLLACLVDAALARSRRGLLTVLALGVFSALVTVTVYLPGVLTAPVTLRGAWEVVGRGRGTVELQDLAVSMVPTPRTHYLLWLLPVVLWLDLGRLRRSWRDLAGAGLATALLALWVIGPSEVGPLRWFSRVVPALMVPLVLLLAVAASRALVTRVSRTRLALSLAWVGVGAYAVVARDPQYLRTTALGAVLVVAALGATAWTLGHRGPRASTGVVLVATLGLLVFQFTQNPQPGAADRHMPAERAQYEGRVPTATGDVMVLGNPTSRVVADPEIADELLIGSAWYLDPEAAVQNGYTTINFRAFHSRFCRRFNGGTCSKALGAVLATEPTTGRPWADLLSVSTLVLFRPSFPTTDPMQPPAGWTTSAVSEHTVVWTRDDPVPSAGGVVATSPGTAVSEELVTDREVRLRVTSVGSGGGTVTLSRLAWPGYSVEGGELAAPLRKMLVRVAVPAGAAGSTVTVRWHPPGWALELTALATALLAGSAWALLAALGPRRRRRVHPDAAPAG